MQKDSNSIYRTYQRMAIYQLARKLYYDYYESTMNAQLFQVDGGKACQGMCKAMEVAMERLGFLQAHKNLTKANFPEYFSYEPKKGWKKHPVFWWTISIKNGGAKKRMAILDRLAEGLSKGE